MVCVLKKNMFMSWKMGRKCKVLSQDCGEGSLAACGGHIAVCQALASWCGALLFNSEQECGSAAQFWGYEGLFVLAFSCSLMTRTVTSSWNNIVILCTVEWHGLGKRKGELVEEWDKKQFYCPLSLEPSQAVSRPVLVAVLHGFWPLKLILGDLETGCERYCSVYFLIVEY